MYSDSGMHVRFCKEDMLRAQTTSERRRRTSLFSSRSGADVTDDIAAALGVALDAVIPLVTLRTFCTAARDTVSAAPRRVR